MADGMMGNSLSQTTEATTARKEEEILVRGQSKHKWNWKFRERERERERDYLACGWARKSNQKYSNMLLTFSLSHFTTNPHTTPIKIKIKILSRWNGKLSCSFLCYHLFHLFGSQTLCLLSLSLSLSRNVSGKVICAFYIVTLAILSKRIVLLNTNQKLSKPNKL